MHVKHVSNVTFFIIYSTDKETPNVVKISANINAMKNINIFAFCSFTVLTRLMLCSYAW